MDDFFNHENHRKSEEFAFHAEQAERQGYAEEARLNYIKAAKLEEMILSIIPTKSLLPNELRSLRKIRSLLGISAISLWIKAHQWNEAIRTWVTLLAKPETLIPEGRQEIELLVEVACRFRQ